MKLPIFLTIAFCMECFAVARALAPPKSGRIWDAELISAGGTIPFQMILDGEGAAGPWRAWIDNGREQFEVPKTMWVDRELTLDIDYFDSRITCQPSEDGDELVGVWTKRRSGGRWTTMRFRATARASAAIEGAPPKPTREPCALINGRWAVRFEKEEDPAVGMFRCHPNNEITGTFLTTTGDYGHIHGEIVGNVLHLRTFDGSHAFLFKAALQEDGSLKGDFWSGDSWHDAWTAKKDPAAALPDPFEQAKVKGADQLAGLSFPDLEGKLKRLDDPSFAGKVRIIELFGSWCPNCHDASEYLAELHRKYKDRGLSVLALAFELSGEAERDRQQVRTFLQKNRVDYPVLIAGTPDREQAAKAFPLFERIPAYPTFLFLDSSGAVKGVYVGFSGPATGAEHTRLRERFEALIEKLLGSEKKG